MKKKVTSVIRRLSQEKLLSGSVILFSGSIIASLGGYLYHLLMGRMLGPSDYGILSSLVSWTYLLGIPVGVLSAVVIKYVSALKEGSNPTTAVVFYHWVEKKLIIIILFVFFILLIISPVFAKFLHLNSVIGIILINFSSLIGVLSTLCSSTLQGFLRFGTNSILSICQSILKLILSVFLVLLGFKVMGAVSAIVFSTLIIYIISVIITRKVLREEKKEQEQKSFKLGGEIFKFAIPVFISSIAFTSIYTVDVLFARHFLSSQDAGLYSSLTVLGKIVYFASSSVGFVMFPIVSGKTAKGESNSKILFISFVVVLLICLGISSLYFIFPSLMVNLLFGKNYLLISSELGLFSIFMTFYSLSSLLNNYYLASSRTKMINLALITAVMQIVLIYFFHQNIRQIVEINIFSSGILLVTFLYPFLKKDKFRFVLNFKSVSEKI